MTTNERTTMRKTLTTRIAIATAVGALTLTGCGSDDSQADDDTDSTSAAKPSAGPSGGPGGFGDIDIAAIQECLDAAGLDDVLPTDMPTGMPTDMPSDFPTDMPTDMPSDFPTDGTPPEGFPSGGAGGGGLQALQDPEVQAALEACGIDLPQAPGGGQ